jgi:hypothetical protein
LGGEVPGLLEMVVEANELLLAERVYILLPSSCLSTHFVPSQQLGRSWILHTLQFTTPMQGEAQQQIWLAHKIPIE